MTVHGQMAGPARHFHSRWSIGQFRRLILLYLGSFCLYPGITNQEIGGITMKSDHAYTLFLAGLVLSLIGMAAWAVAVVAGYLGFAIGAASFGTLGAVILMAGVLDERRHEGQRHELES